MCVKKWDIYLYLYRCSTGYNSATLITTGKDERILNLLVKNLKTLSVCDTIQQKRCFHFFELNSLFLHWLLKFISFRAKIQELKLSSKLPSWSTWTKCTKNLETVYKTKFQQQNRYTIYWIEQFKIMIFLYFVW